MNTPLAWKNLVHNKVRTAVALAGVGFAVILLIIAVVTPLAILPAMLGLY